MLYYVAATRGAHGCNSGIQVTGSHNPKDYNGFKMVLAGRAIYGDDIQRLRQRIEAEDYARAPRRAARRWTCCAEYTRRIVGDCKLARPMKIVVDSGNGIPGARRAGILRALGCEVIELYIRGRRRLSEPPSRSEQAREPGRPDQGREGDRRRTRPGLRRRRRPARAWSPRAATSSIPTARSCCSRSDVLTRAPGAHDHLRREVHRSACRWRSAKPAASR